MRDSILRQPALRVLLATVLVVAVSGTARAAFTATGSMATARNLHTATLLGDGTVLVAGGGGGTGYLTSAEIYDPTTGTFSPTGNLAIPRYLHTATLLADGTVLIVGLASAEIYDPINGTFSTTGGLGTGRDYDTATLLADGTVLVVGGYDETGLLASAEIYDPATGTFSPTGSLATARYDHTATLLADGTVLIVGGVNGNWYLASAEIYDPVTGTFSATGSLETARTYDTATLLADGTVLVVSPTTVCKWRTRFLRDRLDGLFDEPRPGTPRQITDEQVEQVIIRTLETTPQGATHWSRRDMAKASGMSRMSVSRIWKAFRLQPHRSETFKLSTDPLLIDKVVDIVGL
jgi:hypothetical protein